VSGNRDSKLAVIDETDLISEGRRYPQRKKNEEEVGDRHNLNFE